MKLTAFLIALLLLVSSSAEANHRHWRHYHRHYAHTPPMGPAGCPAPEIKAQGPALYRLSRTAAHVLGVTDHSLLFEAVAHAPVEHIPEKTPWAGSLGY